MIVGSIDKNGEVIREFWRQGEIYKNDEAFINKVGVCYVPELSDYNYTYEDFLNIAKGNIKITNVLFEMVDWQSPETLYDDLLNNKEIIECDNCNKPYLTDGDEEKECPYCKIK